MPSPRFFTARRPLTPRTPRKEQHGGGDQQKQARAAEDFHKHRPEHAAEHKRIGKRQPQADAQRPQQPLAAPRALPAVPSIYVARKTIAAQSGSALNSDWEYSAMGSIFGGKFR